MATRTRTGASAPTTATASAKAPAGRKRSPPRPRDGAAVKTSAKRPGAPAGPKRAAGPASHPAADLPAKGKAKLVRDGFTMPKPEYALIAALKQRAAELGHPVKKSEVLRAGIAALHRMTDKEFVATMTAVPSLKTGRPKREAEAASKPRARRIVKAIEPRE